MRSFRLGSWTLIAASALAACASHQARHTAPDESQPHITWEIRTGGPEGEARQVCESAQVKPRCVLPASSETQSQLTTIHIYLHAARQAARYQGTVRIPFLGVAETERPIDSTVPVGARPESLTVVGATTRKPGRYRMSIALKTRHGGKDAAPINYDVDVDVE